MRAHLHPDRRLVHAAERGVEIVAAAAELARSLQDCAHAERPISPEIVRAVYLFYRALLPEASRAAVDALAELTTLELARRHIAERSGEGASAESAAEEGEAARILELRPSPENGHNKDFQSGGDRHSRARDAMSGAGAVLPRVTF